MGFVSYIRVSTQKQGESGLGLEAQREAVTRHLQGQPVLQEFREVESGKSAANRPQLLAAIEMCKRRKAVLVIAKLDRLARNVHFISGLMESKVEFVACDMPHATKLTSHIMAAMAEHEREMISARTKAALQAVKRELEEKGPRTSRAGRVYTELGNPNWQAPLAKALRARNVRPTAPAVLDLMRQHRSEGLTYRAIAAKLNDLNSPSPQGGKWYASTVRRALKAGSVLAVAA
jgi:DNA invertase Pin-like site-specific DNA recombinase